MDFETTSRRHGSAGAAARRPLGHYGPRVAVSMLVVVVLSGGALYASRVSESAPRVVYTASLEEIAAEAEGSLKVDINSADVEELAELPEVGPSTAEAIIEYRNANGQFRMVDELQDVPGIGPKTIEQIKPFAGV